MKKQVLKIKSDHHEVWQNRGLALAYLGRYEEAIADFDQALQIKPDYPLALYNKACCYGEQGNVELAIANLQNAIQLGADRYREMASTDTSFAAIRGDDRLQALLNRPSGSWARS
jgi:tetratricopeptide (TPR) repeat protein